MRKAQQDYVFADGTHLHKGQWVVVPAWALNRSAQTYDNPDTFDALRFLTTANKPGTKPGHQAAIPGDG